MNWYISVLKKYMVFNGRASRSEYWYFMLFYQIITIVLSIINQLIIQTENSTLIIISSLIVLAYILGFLLPALGVTIRRLHDINKSGWWMLVSIIPIIGFLILIYFLVQKGTDGENQYGKNPIINDDKEDIPSQEQQSQTITPQKTTKKVLSCKLYFLKGEFEGSDITLNTNEPLTIGRDPNQSSLIVNDTQISSTHLKLTLKEDELYIQDLNSTNGSFYFDGNSKQKIEQGETISIGKESSGIVIIVASEDLFSFRVDLEEI